MSTATCKCGKPAKFLLLLKKADGSSAMIVHDGWPHCASCGVHLAQDTAEMFERNTEPLKRGWFITVRAA
jgi:hypothetical protein